MIRHPMTGDDVAYTLAQIGQAAEVCQTVEPRSLVADNAVRDATALLQLWGISESDAAVSEVLARLAEGAADALRRPNASRVWHLLARKIEVAKAFVKAYHDQQIEIAAKAKLIDEPDAEERRRDRAEERYMDGGLHL